jgi:CheY-like chemotaxis protein
MTAQPIRVLVAAPQPLHRELVRFFLEEAGCQVVALVASPEDAVCLVASKRPDAVILHESLAAMAGGGFIQRVRHGSTSTKVVVVTPQPERAWGGPSRGADAFVEEWVGIQELGVVLQRLCRGTPVQVQPARVQAERGTGDSSAVAGQDEWLPAPPRPIDMPMVSQARWYERVRGAVAASVVLILLLLGAGLLQLPATSEGRGSMASAHLTSAYSTLEVLAASIRAGRSLEAIAATARRLVAERAAALSSGADTTRLDAAIDAEMSPLLSNVPDNEAAAIEWVLGDLVSSQGLPPSPEPGPGGGAESDAPPEEQVNPQPVGPPGGDADRPGVADPGAQGGSKAQGNSKDKDKDKDKAQQDGTTSPDETPSPTESPSTSPTSPTDSPSTSSTSPTETATTSESLNPTGTRVGTRLQPTASQSAESSGFESPSTRGPTAAPDIPTAAGPEFGSLPPVLVVGPDS